eukprot:g5795.t1
MFRYFMRKSVKTGRLSENGRNNLCNSENEQESVLDESTYCFNPNAPLRSKLNTKNKGAILVKSRHANRKTPDLGTCDKPPKANLEQPKEKTDPVSNDQKAPLWNLRTAEPLLLGSSVTPARADALIKYLAYESACQACFKGLRCTASKEQAFLFLKDNCEVLRRTLNVDSFLRMDRLLDLSVNAQSDDKKPCAEQIDADISLEDKKILRLSASRVKTSSVETEGNSNLLKNSVARQRDIQLKCGDEVIMSPCSKSGRCIGFYKDLKIQLKDSSQTVLTASYLEDGRAVAQGEISVKHLVDLAERLQTDTESESPSPIACKGIKTLNQSIHNLPSISLTVLTDKAFQSPRGSPAQGKWIELTDSVGNALHLCLILKIIGSEDNIRPIMTTPEITIESRRVKRDSAPLCHYSKYQVEFPVSLFALLERRGLDFSIPLRLLLRTATIIEKTGSRRKQSLAGEDLLERIWNSTALPTSHSSCLDLQVMNSPVSRLTVYSRTNSTSLTEYCLGFILDKYGHIQRENLDYLASTVLKVASDIESLCGKVLENYFRLEEESESGLSETNWFSEHKNCPPSALKPAVLLLELLTETKAFELHQWYEEKLKTAAMLKFRRITENCRVEEEIQITEEKQESESSDEKLNNREESVAKNSHEELILEKQEVYKRVKRICTSLVHDLGRDLKIHESGVLPSMINLPQIIATIYCEELKSQLQSILQEIPPESPEPVVIDMLLAVSAFDDYLEANIVEGGLDTPRMYPLGIFSSYIDEWIQGFVASFCEASEAAVAHQHMFDVQGDRIPLLLRNALQFLDDEVLLYERVIKTWSCFGPKIERAICDVLRHVMAIISQECQMFKKTNTLEYSPLTRHQGLENSGPTCWEWKAIFDVKNGLDLLTNPQVKLSYFEA